MTAYEPRWRLRVARHWHRWALERHRTFVGWAMFSFGATVGPVTIFVEHQYRSFSDPEFTRSVQ